MLSLSKPVGWDLWDSSLSWACHPNVNKQGSLQQLPFYFSVLLLISEQNAVMTLSTTDMLNKIQIKDLIWIILCVLCEVKLPPQGMCCKKYRIETETFDMWMMRTDKDSQWHPAPLGGGFQTYHSSESLKAIPSVHLLPCGCAEPGTALSGATLHQHTPALWVQHPLAIRLHWWHLFLQLSLQYHFPADPQMEQTQLYSPGEDEPEGLDLQPPLNPSTCWLWGSPFPEDALTRGDYSGEHGENDQENGRRFF